MKLIKKSEKLLLDKIKLMEEAEEQGLTVETPNIPEPEPIVEEYEEYIENGEINYIPLRTHPIIQSVGNSGWQVSDIWKDVRMDNFSRG
ncbi:hypothetical protein PN483_02735 [Nodularia spumigena CS-591/04]|uniref:hypothetical protein n=1 Tax=Nodularia spumigena TaxID=70799 RepID=UPI00232FDA3C|nr:hypothetical protein [Nodularia spumigena]MDB9322936.1 hypothetical protein [Nodularia spumigena CS-591/07A]MDB9329428.1 hypothetical protein [Nodularia spumigena CS-591/04]